MSILSLFDLKGSQLDAATRLDTHLPVTAGAGSGNVRPFATRPANAGARCHRLPLSARCIYLRCQPQDWYNRERRLS